MSQAECLLLSAGGGGRRTRPTLLVVGQLAAVYGAVDAPVVARQEGDTQQGPRTSVALEAEWRGVPATLLVVNGTRIAGNQLVAFLASFAKDPVEALQAIWCILHLLFSSIAPSTCLLHTVLGLGQRLVHNYVLVAPKWNLTVCAAKVLNVPDFTCVCVFIEGGKGGDVRFFVRLAGGQIVVARNKNVANPIEIQIITGCCFSWVKLRAKQAFVLRRRRHGCLNFA